MEPTTEKGARNQVECTPRPRRRGELPARLKRIGKPEFLERVDQIQHAAEPGRHAFLEVCDNQAGHRLFAIRCLDRRWRVEVRERSSASRVRRRRLSARATRHDRADFGVQRAHVRRDRWPTAGSG
jgi:hypothetical protein